MRPITLAGLLLIAATAGCMADEPKPSTDPAPVLPSPTPAAPPVPPAATCVPARQPFSFTVTNELGEHNVSSPYSMHSGSFEELTWAWGTNQTIELDLNATWADTTAPSWANVQVTNSDSSVVFAEATGRSPIHLAASVAPDDRQDSKFIVMVYPASDPSLPAAASVVAPERDVQIDLVQVLPC